jgi:drug/metabolite transporter (DMT)-like permease
MLGSLHFDFAGFGYAVASGAIASGVGYAIWYTALPALKATAAATVQLASRYWLRPEVFFFSGESITLRFVIAAAAVLGGILLVIVERRAATS